MTNKRIRELRALADDVVNERGYYGPMVGNALWEALDAYERAEGRAEQWGVRYADLEAELREARKFKDDRDRY